MIINVKNLNYVRYLVLGLCNYITYVNFVLLVCKFSVMIMKKNTVLYILTLLAFQTAVLADNIIPFEVVNGLIVVEAEVDGKIGNYIIDSGSNGILLNGRANSSEISYQTLTSSLEGSETKINSFKVGNFEAKELLGFATDLSTVETYLEKDVDGILGCSVFLPHSLIFDFTSSRLTISDKELADADVHDFSRISFKMVEELPLAKVKIDGESYYFILDSGASTHFIDQAILSLDKHEVIPTGEIKSIYTAAGVSMNSKEYTFTNCEMGSEKLSLQAFSKDFSEVSDLLQIKIAGLISLSKLSSGKVYIDLDKNILYYQ